MASPPTGAPERRGLRDSRLGRAALLLVLLAVALLVARTCGNTKPQEVTEEDAIAIAREQIDYEPDRVLVRVIRRGIPPRSAWALSLQELEDGDGPIERVTVVVVDGLTGEVLEIRVEG